MAENTLTYSREGNKWTSRWSYIPDWMIGMNNDFFTWKNGNMYKHYQNPVMNEYYGTVYPSSLTTIFSQGSTDVKIFKTISLDGNSPWDVTMYSEMGSGHINATDMEKLEDMYFGYIRGNQGTSDGLSTTVQGIGNISTVVGTPTFTITALSEIPTNLSEGDPVYQQNAGTEELIGSVVLIDPLTNTITFASFTNTPVAGNFLYTKKNTTAESRPVRGYFLSVTLTSTGSTPIELFEVSTNAAKSYHS